MDMQDRTLPPAPFIMPRKDTNYRGYNHGTYRHMVQRCYLQSHKDYKFYGARGIIVAPHWKKNYEQFVDDLYEEIGPRPSTKHQLDRIDNDKGYIPGNLRWVTSKINNNNRRSNRRIKYNGQIKTASEWGDEYNIPRQQVVNRLNRGWSIEKTLTTPLNRSTRYGPVNLLPIE